jgi:MoxR-like ATPase
MIGRICPGPTTSKVAIRQYAQRMSTDSSTAMSAMSAMGGSTADSISGPTSSTNGRLPTESVQFAAEVLHRVSDNIATVLRGKPAQIETAVLCLAAEGHLLVEDVPGVGKTLLAKALAASVAGATSRVQFTPDLLPSDLTGVTIVDPSTSKFVFRPGPLFANIVLCDEINRASPKVQSALLESMEEKQVSVDNTTHPLPRPFMVIATQNPIEQEGTYTLPESQLDRFLARISVGYPNREAELSVLVDHGRSNLIEGLSAVTDVAEIHNIVRLVPRIHVASVLFGYVVDVLAMTREHGDLKLGASPRAGLAWVRMARARALAGGREYITPEDLQAVAPTVLSHRLLSRTRGVDSTEILSDILASVPVPGSRRG